MVIVPFALDAKVVVRAIPFTIFVVAILQLQMSPNHSNTTKAFNSVSIPVDTIKFCLINLYTGIDKVLLCMGQNIGYTSLYWPVSRIPTKINVLAEILFCGTHLSLYPASLLNPPSLFPPFLLSQLTSLYISSRKTLSLSLSSFSFPT